MIDVKDQKQAPSKAKPKFIAPNKALQKKVGATPFKKESVTKADQFIDENNIDFSPLAKQFLNDMRAALDNAHAGQNDPHKLVEALTEPVMQLKANAATFKYPLITQLMNVLLNFLETLDALNNDSMKIAELSYGSVKVMLVKKMQNPYDKQGDMLVKEFAKAIARYRKRHDG